MKLTLEFEAELGLEAMFPAGAHLIQLLPFGPGRAVAFGAGTVLHAGRRDEQYWLLDIGAQGVTRRTLPLELTRRLDDLTDRKPGTPDFGKKIRAFRLDETIGLLVGTQEIYLLAAIDAEPRLIEIDNPFTRYADLRFHASGVVSHYLPERCGHACGSSLPVTLSSPEGRAGEPRSACLLDIDAAAGRAHWRLGSAKILPRSIAFADYEPFLRGDTTPGIAFDADGGLVRTAPLILDCAWRDDAWELFVAGFSQAFWRFGAGPAVLSRNRPDLSLIEKLFQAGEDGFGRFCASRDRMVFTPLRQNGPAKGKQSIYLRAEGREIRPTLPRGFAKHVIEKHGDGTWWLTPQPLHLSNDRVVACR